MVNHIFPGYRLTTASLLFSAALAGEVVPTGAALQPSLKIDLTAENAASDWLLYGGPGKLEKGELVLDGRHGLSYAVYRKSEWSDVRLEARFMVEPAKHGVLACGFMVRAKDGETYYYVHYDRAQAILVRYSPGKPWTEIKRAVNLDKPAGKWHHAAVETVGKRLRVFLNDKLLYEAEHPLLKEGRIGFYASQGRAHIKDIVVSGPSSTATQPFKTPKPFGFGSVSDDAGIKLVSVERLWDKARHNAFTDLIRFKGKWYCAFREGDGHVSKNGALRVLTSDDGKEWTTAVLLTSPTADLRDAKLSVTASDELMLSGAGALHNPDPVRHQSMAWFSKDGTDWTEAVNVGDPNLWLWSVTWHRKHAYGVGYSTVGPKLARLYKSATGRVFDTLIPTFHDQQYPNETSLVFTKDDIGYCLLRRGGTGLIGTSWPPYTDWNWKDLRVAIGGPKMIQLEDGRFLATVRLYKPKAHTALVWIQPDLGKLEVVHRLPSGGDTSYAGMVVHDGLLWVSYYSSHQGKTSIYLAKLKVEPMSQVLSDEQRKEYLDALTQTMKDEPEWIGIHAAEALIRHDQGEAVHTFFQSKSSEKTPKYRIGVWRVLARSAVDKAERAKWILKIREALKDPKGEDRLHAAETLAKLGDEERSAQLEDAAKGSDSMAAYARWALLRSGGEQDEQRLAEFLSAKEPGTRASTAYSFRNQEKISPKTLALLKASAAKEADDSPAKIYMLSAVYTHSDGVDQSKARRQLIDFAQNGSRGQKYELCTALGLSGDMNDVSILRNFYKEDDPDVKVAAAEALLSLAGSGDE